MGKTKAEILRENNLDKELNRTRVLDVFSSAPVPFGLTIPKGWILSDKGIFEQKFNEGDVPELKQVTYEPIVITETFRNLTDNSEGLIVTWYNGFEWREISRSMDYFMSSAKIIELSLSGFPVNSINAKSLIKYLSDFYALNRLNVPNKIHTEQFGWIGDGFLLANQYISSSDGANIEFLPADVGEEQLANAYQSNGNIETWLKIFERISQYPKVLVGLYASFASVLLKIFGLPVFILEWSGETSKGKTVSLKIAASVWGKPTINNDGIIKSWNATPVSIERSASLLNNIPLFIDDTKNLPSTIAVSNLIYNLASGQGKGRGSTKGSQKTKFWNNITFSTGEQKITTFSKEGGTAGRVIPITGLPFENTDVETAQIVDEIQMEIQECYGVAGEAWLRYIIANEEYWNDWLTYFKLMQEHYVQKAEGNSVVGRLAQYMAVIDTAARLFNDCFDVEFDFRNSLKNVWDSII